MPGTKRPSQPQTNVTFGWEVEFFLCSDVKKSKKTKLRELGQKILDQNLPVALHYDPASLDVQRFLRNGSTYLVEKGDIAGYHAYSYFRVLLENIPTTAEHPKPNGGKATAFEITSPIFDHRELEAGLPQTKSLLSALRHSESKITAHTGCGLHFHVGIESGLDVLTVQKAATLVMLLELSLFQVLVPSQRRGEKKNFKPIVTESGFSKLDYKAEGGREKLRQHSTIPFEQLKPANWNNGTPEIWHSTLIKIWAAQTLSDLSKGLCDDGIKIEPENEPEMDEDEDEEDEEEDEEEGDDEEEEEDDDDEEEEEEATNEEKKNEVIKDRTCLALCLRDKKGHPMLYNSSKIPDGKRSTIEFKYPPTTFDPEYIKHWAELVYKVVEIASRDTASFSQVIENVYRRLVEPELVNNTEKWARLLSVLELGQSIDFWRQQIRRFEEAPIHYLDANGFLLQERN